MILHQLFRTIHTNVLRCQTTNKQLLSKLRKKTGYTFINCKKALQLHNDNLEKAEQWLKEQAQQQGWTQAAKLQSRITSQGLIAMIVEKNHGVLVEVNCETDFVARNKKFHDLVEIVAATVLNHATTTESDALVKKDILNTDVIKALSAKDGKCLADHSALAIGSVGENINIRRALCMSVHPDIKLFGCTHPNPINPTPTSFGKYGALIALKCKTDCRILGTQLCQHIIGMNPTKVGDARVDEPYEKRDEEPVLLYQEFLLEPDISVQQLLKNEQAEIVDFVRYEMGEIVETDPILDSVENCG